MLFYRPIILKLNYFGLKIVLLKMKKLPITSWLHEERPREKLLAKGIESLTDSELVAILLGSGSREESAVTLAHNILQSVNGNIGELARLSIEKLTEFKGIGEAKAISIVTALELGKRRQSAAINQKSKIGSSRDAFAVMQPILADKLHEEFWVMYLNNSNKILSKFQLSKGGLTATLVDTRILLKRALELSAVAIIICHNHPSGKLQPSRADIELTKKIKEASKTLDIKLLDHIIVTEKTYFSFADENHL